MKLKDYLAVFEVTGRKPNRHYDDNDHFWVTIQATASNSVVLHIGKIFDDMNKRH
jgi:hypothetical protein